MELFDPRVGPACGRFPLIVEMAQTVRATPSGSFAIEPSWRCLDTELPTASETPSCFIRLGVQLERVETMVNDDADPPAEAGPTREFYVPATFQFSSESGRIERILVGLFEQRGDIEARRITEDSTPGFYVPAMFQFSTEPGRIERFLTALFTGADDEGLPDIPSEFRDDFYLPAANPDGFRPPKEQAHAPLVPTSEVTTENGNH